MDQVSTTTERHLLHFRADSLSENDRILTFHAGLATHRVHAHTRATQADARVGNPFLQHLPDAAFTHYLEVDLPSDAVLMTYLTNAIEIDGTPTEDFLSLMVHVPRASRHARAARSSLLHGVDAVHPKLAWLMERNAEGTSFDAFAQAYPGVLESDLVHDLVSPFDTAASLLYQHPTLINLSSGEVPEVILRDCVGRALRRLPLLVEEIDDLGAAWSRRVPLLEADGRVVKDDKGETVFTLEVHPDVRRRMSGPMGLAIKYSQQMQELHGQTWRLHYGETLDEHRPPPAGAVARSLLRADQTRWTLKALGRTNGVQVGRVDFQPPRFGGWTIRETWSADDAVPMTSEIVAALAEGRVVAHVDAIGKESAWVGAFPAQQLKEDDFTVFAAAHTGNTVGSDFAGVTLTLDALRTDLQLDVRITAISTADSLAGVRIMIVDRNGVTREAWRAQASTQGAYGNLRVDAVNEWLRHLSCYAEFHDAAGAVIVPVDWPSRMPRIVGKLFDKHASKKYIDVISPVDTVFGIPLGPATTTLDIPVPENAASVTLYWGGLGTGTYDETVCAVGITCTSVLCMAFPVILLLMGASEKDSRFITSLMRDPDVRYGLYFLGASLVGAGTGGYIGLAQNPGRAATTIASALLPALAKSGLKKLAQYFARKGAEGAMRRSTPLVHIAFLAFDTAVTLFQLAQTTAAVLQSPFFYTKQLTRTFDLVGRVLPDPEFNRFPDHHDVMIVRVLYDAGNTLPVQEFHLPPETLSDPLPFRFDEIAAGGRIKVFVFFYAANGWQSAVGASRWMDAKGSDGNSQLHVDVMVKNALVPLSRSSVYEHRQALSFEGGRHVWRARGAPVTTVSDADALITLGGITVAQQPGMLAYSWQARGLNLPRDRSGDARVNDPMHAMQNISLLQDPDSAYAIAPIGFTLPCGVAYDIGSAADGSGANFYLDPSAGDFDPVRNLGGGYQLRRIEIVLGKRPDFEPGSARSWGRFPRPLDGFAVHPQGYVVGVNAADAKLYILHLPSAATDNEQATMASLYSGEGARVGLLSRPRAIAVALDGRLLVLEEGNRRIQSFDISGNPVPYFREKGSREHSAVMPLRTTSAPTTAYLDLSVEAKGYLFVLACDYNGSSPDHYRVDIYEPDGNFLVSTPRVAAARIAVDLARSLYVLNWETLVGPDNRIEPTVSLWLPPPPAAQETI